MSFSSCSMINCFWCVSSFLFFCSSFSLNSRVDIYIFFYESSFTRFCSFCSWSDFSEQSSLFKSSNSELSILYYWFVWCYLILWLNLLIFLILRSILLDSFSIFGTSSIICWFLFPLSEFAIIEDRRTWPSWLNLEVERFRIRGGFSGDTSLP